MPSAAEVSSNAWRKWLYPLIFILPLFVTDPGAKVLMVFLAEPVSDVVAAAVTTGTFFMKFKKLTREEIV